MLICLIVTFFFIAETIAIDTAIGYDGKAINYDERWGYVTVRAQCHTFWWLFFSTDATNRPLIMWLQGGPGAASTGFGNFDEIGPKDINGNNVNRTWLQVADLVFVDNPVGTGFSYVDQLSALTSDVQQISNDLMAWARSFFALHSEYQTRPFYIFSESYGGKMAAVFANDLQQAIAAGQMQLNFRGVGLGDSWISPIDYVNTWGPYLKAFSFLDAKDLTSVNTQAQRCQNLVDSNQWTDATYCWGDMENVVGGLTDSVSWYNVLKKGDTDDWSQRDHPIDRIEQMRQRHLQPFTRDAIDDYMNGPMRQKFGIIPSNVRFGAQSGQVFSHQYGDFMKPVYATVDSLLNANVNVIIFNGQMDLICDTLGTEMWVNRLTWSGKAQFLATTKRAFHVGTGAMQYQTAGFLKRFSNLQFWYINRAGHMVAYDQPEASINMLTTIFAQ
jgi:serine carboxypeptidase 1